VSRPPRARRSCHAVPATAPRMVERATALDADMVFLDLEDSVAPEAKGEASRAAVVAALRRDWRAPTVGVRVNAVGGPHCHGDLAAVVAGAGDRLDVVVLPKVEDEGQVAFAHHLLSGLESEAGLPPGRIGLEAQIESARGLVRAEAIAAACPGRLEALVLGPGDLAASLGMPQTTIGAPVPGYPGDGWHHALTRVLVAARAAGLQAVDGPYAGLRDEEGLRAAAARARALGYDGKWSIHPDQVPVLNAVFAVGDEEVARAREILGAHARAGSEGRGAARLAGEMIDEATRRMAEGVLARARREGGP